MSSPAITGLANSAIAPALHFSMQAGDWFNLLLHYMMLSMLSVGGAISTLPDMHRYLVTQQHWLTDAQFNSSIALAQAAPGPNVLFIALMGWNVGMNTGNSWNALLGMLVTMSGIMIPSTTLTYMAANWGHKNRDLRGVRAFKLGMAPIVVGLLLATGWIMAAAHNIPAKDWPLWLLTAVCCLVVWRTRLHLLWLLALGAVLGWFGLV
ncbi:chromate transporter [Undibacterium sp. Rencai35W]|uniref:chromate transporter n=1 Tax=Undibacterium sp. Rencai35W TaxID=3413046 RepID=UPI003BF3990A